MNRIKNTSLTILLIVLFSINVFATCEQEQTIETTGKILKELKIKKRRSAAANESDEFALLIKVSVKGTSWQKKDAEAAVLTIFVDGKYNQDVILFAGEENFEYQMPLGKYNSGEHRITIVQNKDRSAPKASKVKIQTASAILFKDLNLKNKSAEQTLFASIAVSNAPIIYLRENTIDKFSDIPLLTYYGIFDETENIKKFVTLQFSAMKTAAHNPPH